MPGLNAFLLCDTTMSLAIMLAALISLTISRRFSFRRCKRLPRQKDAKHAC